MSTITNDYAEVTIGLPISKAAISALDELIALNDDEYCHVTITRRDDDDQIVMVHSARELSELRVTGVDVSIMVEGDLAASQSIQADDLYHQLGAATVRPFVLEYYAEESAQLQLEVFGGDLPAQSRALTEWHIRYFVSGLRTSLNGTAGQKALTERLEHAERALRLMFAADDRPLSLGDEPLLARASDGATHPVDQTMLVTRIA